MLRRLPAGRGLPFVLFGAFFVLFLLTTNRDLGTLSIDPKAAAMAAWNLAETGSFVIADPPVDAWLQPTDGGFVVRRQPGVIAAGVPFYLAARPFTDGFSIWPAAVAAATYAALAVALLAVLLLRLGASHRSAATAAVVGGLGTATWSVAADGLWTHGPDQALLLTALLAFASERYWSAGLAMGLACTVRTHLAVVAAVLGLWAAARARSVWPAVKTGLLAACGVAVVVAYAATVFAAPTLNGGYQGSAGDPSAELVRRPVLDHLENLAGLLVSPDRGVFLTTPFVLPLLLSGVLAIRQAPWWVRGSALGAALYLLLQARVNHWSGGAFFWGSRLTLEPLTLCAPLLWHGWRHLPQRSDVRAAVTAAMILAVAYHLPGAAWFTPHDTVREWSHFWPADLVLYGPHEVASAVVFGTGLLAAATLVLRSARTGRRAPEP